MSTTYSEKNIETIVHALVYDRVTRYFQTCKRWSSWQYKESVIELPGYDTYPLIFTFDPKITAMRLQQLVKREMQGVLTKFGRMDIGGVQYLHANKTLLRFMSIAWNPTRIEPISTSPSSSLRLSTSTPTLVIINDQHKKQLSTSSSNRNNNSKDEVKENAIELYKADNEDDEEAEEAEEKCPFTSSFHQTCTVIFHLYVRNGSATPCCAFM